MTPEKTKTDILKVINSFSEGNVSQKGIALFKALGYVTDRQANLENPVYEEFRDNYILETTKFNETNALVAEWMHVDILFQLSKEEVLKQTSLFDTKQVDRTIIETYLFITIELSGSEYTRTQLSQITREVNRVFPMPVLILFKYSNFLTLSVINRRLHKRDDSKDVLEKVTQIKDIQIDNPHRAHIEILFDLSFDELNRKFRFTNFVELHNAWQKTLDIKELNKRFYSELFNWYLWAVQSVRFPNDVADNKDDMVYNSESVIRLLTRLIFVWFIKEKGLVPEVLFDERIMKGVLKNFNPNSKLTSDYYRAILQNLFFATLNTQMDKDVNPENKRRFVNPEPKYNNPDYTDQTKYRYKDYFVNPDEALKLFSTIPFLNGGLFECLDSRETDPKSGKDRELRFDGFSTYKEKQAFVPDNLFFTSEVPFDLNNDYGTKGKNYKVKGLMNILNSYKFTITENTPLDEEVALDPELLGKVFENLLASYNPETQSTARKQTGSFYTPREIVNYMVDESLIAYLKQKLGDTSENEERLRQLFYSVEQTPTFTTAEIRQLIIALSTAKILDPACGSGAFPMGILHRMVDLLNKLDPDNKIWFELQKQRAIEETAEVFESGDTNEREIRLNEINKAFDLNVNNPDYARKLFLIENCIYGVDIQQIAIQISKLRFFISLIVDQKVDDTKPNRNILSMPNLETRFVAANTLIGLDKPQQLSLMEDEVKLLEKELVSIRHKIFFTRKYNDKKELKKQDKLKRDELEKALERSGYTKNTATQMAGWNPFDPMKSAPFFDIETMFGFRDGFDVVIGNPPYVEAKKLKDISQILRKSYSTYSGTADLYVYFYENGVRNLKPNGTLVFITSNKFIKTSYGENLRKYFTGYKINEIIDFTDVHVFEALVASCIFSITKKQASKNDIIIAFANDSLTDFSGLWNFINQNKFYLNQDNLSEKIWQLENESKLQLKSKIEEGSVTILQTGSINVYRGVTTGYNPAFIIDEAKRVELIRDDEASKEIIKPMLQGRNIRKWVYNFTTEYIIFTRKGIKIDNYPAIKKYLSNFKQQLEPGIGRKPGNYNWYEIQDNTAYYPEFEKEKIIWGLTSDKWTFAYDNDGNYLPSNGYILTSNDLPVKYILALINSKLMEFYFGYIGIMTAGGAFTLKYETVVEFPIKITSKDIQDKFIAIVDYILFCKSNGLVMNIFEQVLNEMVYELYFTEQVKSAGCEVIDSLNNLPQLKTGNDEATLQANLRVIEKLQKELSEPNHPVSIAMFKMDTIEEIRIIEGK